MRVLVVDDDVDVRRMLVSILEDAGHEVLAAANGFEGLARLRDDPGVRLVLVDGEMPAMDGPQMLLRRQGRLPPAIGMSGDLEMWGPRLRAAGCEVVLAKPFEVSALLGAVERATGVAACV